MVMTDDSTTPFQDYTRKHYTYIKDLLANPSPETIQRFKKFFSTVQSHLKMRMSAFRYALEAGEPTQIWEFKGIGRLAYDPTSGRFTEEFEPEGVKFENRLDLTVECQMIETRYFTTIRSLALYAEKGRLKACKKCGLPFFQATEREKLFCSTKCARATAQAEYSKRVKKQK